MGGTGCNDGCIKEHRTCSGCVVENGSEKAIAQASAYKRGRRRIGLPLHLGFTVLACILLATLCLAGSADLVAYADESGNTTGKRIVRVACYDDGDYMSVDETGARAGYNIEYLNEIQRYADWTYEFVDYPSWKQAYAALESGEVDLLPAVYYTEERADRMLFSAAPMCNIYTTLNVRLDDTRYAFEDFQQFSGMKVGVIEGSEDADAFVEYS